MRKNFRVLVIDDDEKALSRIASEVRGISLSRKGRSLETAVSTLRVKVEPTSSGYSFSSETLFSLAQVAEKSHDLVILDYSFAADEIQPRQWREGNHTGSRLETNDHLLTIVDLQHAALTSTELSIKQRKQIERFFASPCEVVLRSFQHDRPVDHLGPYEARYNNTAGVFARAEVLRLDSFAMIYGSDADLRKEFYIDMARGRDFYRNIVLQMTLLHVQASLGRRMSDLNHKVLIPRVTGVLALITSAIWGIAAVLASFGPGIVTAISDDEWGDAAKLLFVVLVVTVVATWILTVTLDRGVRAAFDRSED
ncbi:hypothetical protein [Rhodococcus aetherivorans]